APSVAWPSDADRSSCVSPHNPRPDVPQHSWAATDRRQDLGFGLWACRLPTRLRAHALPPSRLSSLRWTDRRGRPVDCRLQAGPLRALTYHRTRTWDRRTHLTYPTYLPHLTYLPLQSLSRSLHGGR